MMTLKTLKTLPAPVSVTDLVSVHGQQSFVEVDGLQLLPCQLVFDTLGVRQLHLFLRVENILVLREQTEALKKT